MGGDARKILELMHWVVNVAFDNVKVKQTVCEVVENSLVHQLCYRGGSLVINGRNLSNWVVIELITSNKKPTKESFEPSL